MEVVKDLQKEIQQHYERYPMMWPYKGKDFGKSGRPSLLLVGESHYLPDYSTQHLEPEKWYKSDCSTLNDEERGWIATAPIMEWARSVDFSNKAHSIWSNSFWEINHYGPRYKDYKCVADDVAAYNFFLRPGIEGDSLHVSQEDAEIANAAFELHFKSLKPTAVIFLSQLARWHFRKSIIGDVPLIVTPHPGCAWWNKKAKRYGNKRGRDILGDFISATWPQSEQPVTP
jgi:hypothetical protein